MTYEARPVRFLELWQPEGWRIKVYGIRYGGDLPDPPLVRAGKKVAARRLIDTASGTGHYGVGFLGVHQGRDANFVFVDWWADENELHHHVWLSPEAAPLDLRESEIQEPVACVWDLAVLAFERRAWVEEVMKPGLWERPDAYLARRLDGPV